MQDKDPNGADKLTQRNTSARLPGTWHHQFQRIVISLAMETKEEGTCMPVSRDRQRALPTESLATVSTAKA